MVRARREEYAVRLGGAGYVVDCRSCPRPIYGTTRERKALVTTTRGISEDVFRPDGCEVFVFGSMATDIYLLSLRH